MSSEATRGGAGKDFDYGIRDACKKISKVFTYVLGINTALLSFVGYLYWAFVGLVYEYFYFERYQINVFDFAVIEDIAFFTAKNWFLFLVPFIIPIMPFLILSIVLLLFSFLLREISLRVIIDAKKY